MTSTLATATTAAVAHTSNYFPLATETDYSDTPVNGNDEGAAGSSSGISISTGGLVAIIVVVVVVVIIGISTATLFFIAKRHEWTMKETLRKSAKKVVTALTPRRTEFPSSVKDPVSSSRRHRTRLDDVPPTPRLRPEDLEKGMAKAEAKRLGSKWGRK